MDTLTTLLQPIFGDQIDWKQVFLIGMTPLFLLAFVVEFSVQKQREKTASFQFKEVFANLSLGAAYQIFEALMWVVFTAAIFAWVYSFRLFDVPVNGWTIVPIYVAVELCFYIYHRSSHRIRWFWAAHVPHHSGEFMNFTTAMRQSVLNAFSGIWVFYIGLCFLGVPPVVVMFCLAVSLAYQYFIHTESIGKLPRWFEAVFNTPSHHRVHHGRNPQYIDKNYGGSLIIFDRLFGTFEPEVETVTFGITEQIHSYNPLVLNVHEAVDMFRDAMAPGAWHQRVKHFVMPPDWQRPGHRSIRTWPVTSHAPRAERTITPDIMRSE